MRYSSVIQSKPPLTTIKKGAKCYSACVVVLAGSFLRAVQGQVAIHRPHFVGLEVEELGYTDLKEAYNDLYNDLSIAFSEWNLSNTLIDDMFIIPSDEIRVLSYGELRAYGLNSDDLVFVEQKNALTRLLCGPDVIEMGKKRMPELARCTIHPRHSAEESICFKEWGVKYQAYSDCNMKIRDARQ